jgi:phosphate butyryltransferase
MPISTLDQLVARAQALPPCRMAVVAAHDPEVLKSVDQAQKQGIAAAILLGDARQIESIAGEHDLELRGIEIQDQPDDALAAVQAMTLVREQRANVVAKGQVKTALFLKAALDRQRGLRGRRLFSHVGLFQVPGFDRLLFMSDSGVILYPTTMQKLAIVQNVVDVARKLGLPQPRVAILSANEQVHPSRPAGVEALLLARMAAERWVSGALVDGPLPLDVALYPEIARARQVAGPVAGQADVVIVPNVEAGNIAAKAIQYVGHGEMAGVVVGARVPLIINSRADDVTTRLRSVALASVLAANPGAT